MSVYEGEAGYTNSWRTWRPCTSIHHEEEVADPMLHLQVRGHRDELLQRLQAARGPAGRDHQDPGGH